MGLMSGTSCDGVDAAIVDVAGRGRRIRVRLVGHHHVSYPSELRRRLLAVMSPARTATQEISELHAALGRFYAAVARSAVRRIRPTTRIHLVGVHGQTICHLPRSGNGATLQIGEPSHLAVAMDCPVIADFRQADLAVGGQGAPLVPWTDYILFGHPRRSRAMQNIGGIANITYLPAGGRPEDVIAFDTGPGNMVIDELVRVATHGRCHFDARGARAARGLVLEPILSRWLRHPFFARRPPRSAGRDEFGRTFVRTELPRLRAASDRPEDWIATATAFTARTIAGACRCFLRRSGGVTMPIDELIVAGGGAANITLLAMLAAEFPGVPVRTLDALGIPIDAKEAVSFAMLAVAHADGVAANLPQVTGARTPAILGKLCPPPSR